MGGEGESREGVEEGADGEGVDTEGLDGEGAATLPPLLGRTDPRAALPLEPVMVGWIGGG